MKTYKLRRSIVTALLLLMVALLFSNQPISELRLPLLNTNTTVDSAVNEQLTSLEVKGRAPKTGYSREQFGDGWAKQNGCDVRNLVLARDLSGLKIDDSCHVQSGTLNDPYTGNIIYFTRGETTSDDVQIDHVVALSDAWQKGAQLLTYDIRVQFANDPLNLLAVDGSANQQKSDSDAASWLPLNKAFRCQYIERQVQVKKKYKLWVTAAEQAAMARVLSTCG